MPTLQIRAEQTGEARSNSPYLAELFGSVEVALHQNNHYAALALCENALAEISGADHALHGRILVRMGDIYADLNDSPNALNQYQQALNVFDEAQDVEMSAVVLHLLGVLYGHSGDYDSAFTCLHKALTIFHEMGKHLMEVSVIRNIGAVCLVRGDLQNALDYELRALTVYDALQDNQHTAATLITIGDIRERMEEPETAGTFYLRASEILGTQEQTTASGRSDTLLSAALLGLGRVYRKIGDVRSALFALEQGLAIATEEQDQQQSLHFHRELSRVHELTGEYRSALEQLRLYTELRDKFVNEERHRAMTELQMRFDLEREIKEEELRHQHDVTSAVLHAQEIERRRIASELHDGIGQILAAARINMLRLQPEQFVDAEKKAYQRSIELIGEAAGDVRIISHSLGSSTLRELGIIPALREIIADMNDSGSITFSFEANGIDTNNPETTSLGIFRIAQELIANVVRHSQATEATIQLFQRDGVIMLMVEDNGTGFDPARQIRGMGTQNIEARAQAMNGSVRLDSSPGHGTTVTIEVPVPDTS